MRPKFSVVIPIYNETLSIKSLYSSLRNVMEKISVHYEIIFVNDGSTDDSLNALFELKGPNLLIADLSRRYGQSLAMQAGFNMANGDFVITLDGDLQNDPEDIPKLIDKLNQGYDAVCGWRRDRKDPLNRRIMSKAASFLLRLLTGVNIHDFGCTLRIFKRKILSEVYLSKGMHRFLVLLIYKLGYNIGEIEVKHNTRIFGRSKYNIINRLPESFIAFSRILLTDIHKLMKPKNEYRINRIIKNEDSQSA